MINTSEKGRASKHHIDEYRGTWIPKEKQEMSLHRNHSFSDYLPVLLGARKVGAGMKRYKQLNLSLTSQWYLSILSQTQPVLERKLVLQRGRRCVYPKKTGSSFTTGFATAEVTPNLWCICSVRKAFYRDGWKHGHGHCWSSQHLACFSGHALRWHPFKQHSVIILVDPLHYEKITFIL